MKTKKKEVSIYIHIPFCERKCLYCDFLSAPAAASERDAYVKALLMEIKKEAETLQDYVVTTVFIGGGTPSLLTAEQLCSIMEQIKKHFHCAASAEISMECNPGTVDLQKLQAFKSAGINRLSIGLQSTDNNTLAVLGRIHTYEQFLATFQQAREAGFTNINIDIMSALPGQDRESNLATLKKVTSLQPEHISAYSLIIEEGTPFFTTYGTEENQKALPDEEEERAMYYDTQHHLQAAGYHHYEISNYAKKGFECRHNLVYWTGKDYVGFGTGAASYFEGVRYHNLTDTKEYCNLFSQNKLCKQEIDNVLKKDIQVLSEMDKKEEYMFVGLRLLKGVSITDFAQQFGVSMEEEYGFVIQTLIEEKLLYKKGDYLKLSKRGVDISNYVMAQFLH